MSRSVLGKEFPPLRVQKCTNTLLADNGSHAYPSCTLWVSRIENQRTEQNPQANAQTQGTIGQ